MGIEWLTPAAAVGLGLLAIPIAVHLFARAPLRRGVVPSLRPIDPHVPSLRRRRHLREPWLLAVRLGTVAAAVLASAGPLLTTPAREAAWATRVVRAVIVDPALAGPALDSAIAEERRDAAAVEIVTAAPPMSGVAAALAWLDRQPPARREVVVVGDGVGPDRIFAASIPEPTGVRFRRATSGRGRDADELWVGATVDSGGLRALRVPTTPDTGREAVVAPMPTLPVVVRAAPGEQSTAEAIWHGVVAEGAFLRAESTWRPIEIIFAGGTRPAPESTEALTEEDRLALLPIAIGSTGDGNAAASTTDTIALARDVRATRDGATRIVGVDAPVEPERAARILRAVLALAAGEDGAVRARRAADAADRAAVERPATGVPRGAASFEPARDSRWLWLLALAGLVIEQIVRSRRDRRLASAQRPADVSTEATA